MQQLSVNCQIRCLGSFEKLVSRFAPRKQRIGATFTQRLGRTIVAFRSAKMRSFAERKATIGRLFLERSLIWLVCLWSGGTVIGNDDFNKQLFDLRSHIERGNFVIAYTLATRTLAEIEEARDQDSVSRERRRCLVMLINVSNRLNRREDTIRFALRYRSELRDETGPDLMQFRQENALKIAENMAALGNYSESRALLLEMVSESNEFGKLKLFPLLECRFLLAIVEELSRSPDVSRKQWEEVFRIAKQLFSISDTQGKQHVLKKLLVGQEIVGNSKTAETIKRQLMASYGNHPDAKNLRRMSLIEISSQLLLAKQYLQAEKHIRDALGRSNRTSPAAAFLSMMLANTLQMQRRVDEARHRFEQTAQLYQALVTATESEKQQFKTIIGYKTQQRRAYLAAGKSQAAVKVADDIYDRVRQQFGDEHRLTINAKSELGSLHALSGHYAEAKPHLREVVAFWRKHQPIDELKLASALNNLAAVERATGDSHIAGQLFREALEIRQKHLPLDHPDLAASNGNYASVLVARGQYSQAIQTYNKVLAQCRERGQRANRLHSTTLLNLAVAYKSQGQYERAIEYCLESLDLHTQVFGEGTIDSVAHYNTLAALCRVSGRYTDAYRYASESLKICSHSKHGRHAMAGTAHYNLGVISRLSGAFESAIEHFERAVEIQRQNGQQVLEGRTLNNLGLLKYQQFKLATHADVRFREKALGEMLDIFEAALKAQNETYSPPQDRYNSLCNLSMILKLQGNAEKARQRLDEAILLIEAPRAAVSGAERQRAEFLSRFSSAFDMKVKWSLEENDLDAAFITAERARNRTFLDQLGLAGVDLRTTLTGKDGQTLIKKEKLLRNRLAALQAQARSIIPQSLNQLSDADRGKGAVLVRSRKLSETYALTQKEYEKVLIAIRDASPVYRNLLTSNRKQLSLKDIKQLVLEKNELLLFYHIGADDSFLLVIGDPVLERQAFPLRILPNIATAFSTAIQAEVKRETQLDERGAGGVVKSKKGEPLRDRDNASEITSGVLTRKKAAVLVAWYVSALRNKSFLTRGMARKTVRSKKGRELTEPMALLSDVLLPAGLREIIRRNRTKSLIIVLDGALQSLPFEALLLKIEAKQPKFVLDKFPPIAYAPSANILAALVQRSKTNANARRRLLTVGNPSYPKPPNDEVRGIADNLTRDAFLGLLPRLPGTQTECNRIESAFGRAGTKVTALLADNATEDNVVQSIAGNGFVHLAAHGLVDESHENLFGSIALTPPARRSASNREDGFLRYHEILNLPLSDCEMAVLSACQTNVGPERPMEAGASLAQAFLAAGARRVVASHWSVSDASTAELMSVFFKEIASAQSSNTPLDYSDALQKARKHIRNDPRWSSPYYWAPFVLLGPARD